MRRVRGGWLGLGLLVALSGCAHEGAGQHGHDGGLAHEHGQESGADAYVHHGHRHHDFSDAASWAVRFENPERDAWQKPDAVIAMLGLARDSVVADIGAATGYFPVRLARAVPEGRVWGVDIEPGMVRFLNDRARDEGLENLFSILGTPEDPLLPEPVDVVLMVDTYHHVESRSAYFASLASRLRDGARVVIVDFKMGDLPVGPPDAMKVPPETIEAEMRAAGYERVERDGETLPYQNVFVFQRAPAP